MEAVGLGAVGLWGCGAGGWGLGLEGRGMPTRLRVVAVATAGRAVRDARARSAWWRGRGGRVEEAPALQRMVRLEHGHRHELRGEGSSQLDVEQRHRRRRLQPHVPPRCRVRRLQQPHRCEGPLPRLSHLCDQLVAPAAPLDARVVLAARDARAPCALRRGERAVVVAACRLERRLHPLCRLCGYEGG